jgi:hypothetical protein
MKRTLASTGIAIALVVIAACGSSAKSTPAAGPNTFTLNEFSIAAPSSALHAGRVAITADNVGRETHEIVIVAASSTNDLPTKADGSVDEDKIPAAEKMGEIADIAARTRRSKSFELKAGSYIAFCNLVDAMGSGTNGGNGMMGGTPSGMMNGGHVHYALGMRITFTVR